MPRVHADRRAILWGFWANAALLLRGPSEAETTLWVKSGVCAAHQQCDGCGEELVSGEGLSASRPLVGLQGWCLSSSQGGVQAWVIPCCSRPALTHAHRVGNCRKTLLLPSHPHPRFPPRGTDRGSREPSPREGLVPHGDIEKQLLQRKARLKAGKHFLACSRQCVVQQTHAHCTERSYRYRGMYVQEVGSAVWCCWGGDDPRITTAQLGREGLLRLVETKARLPSPCRSRLSMREQPPQSLLGCARLPPAPRHTGRGKEPLRSWVRLASVCTGRGCSSSHSKTEAAECLYGVSTIKPFAGMSSIYTYVQSPTPSLLLVVQRGAGWLGCPGFASLISLRSGHGSRQVPPKLSWSLAVLLPWLFAVWALEQAGSGAEIRHETRVRGWGLEAGREGQRRPWVGKWQLSFQT